MTQQERKEHALLSFKWATGKATRIQILRCMELDRKSTKDAAIAKEKEAQHA